MWRNLLIIAVVVVLIVVLIHPFLRELLGGLKWPTESRSISSDFGNRTHPVTGETNKFHNGIDIPGSTGTPVYASGSGKVIASTNDSISGNYVKIKHPSGFITGYAHLSHRLVNEGATVKAGQLIGKVGSTGRSTGPHLHFNVRNSKNKFIDPEILLP